MPKINLLPKNEIDTKPLGYLLKWSLSYGRYIIISVELVVFLVFFSRFIYDRQLADLNDSIEQKQAIIASAQEFETQFRNVQDKISYIETIDTDRTIYLDMITILKRITPLQVTYDNISLQETELSLEGNALTNESFAQFLAQLKATDEFSTISLNSISKEEEDENTIYFTLAIDFSNQLSSQNISPQEDSDSIDSNTEGF